MTARTNVRSIRERLAAAGDVIGEYRGFKIVAVSVNRVFASPLIALRGEKDYEIELSDSKLGNMARLDNALKSIESEIEDCGHRLETLAADTVNLRGLTDKPFEREAELEAAAERQLELTKLLSLTDKRGDGFADDNELKDADTTGISALDEEDDFEEEEERES